MKMHKIDSVTDVQQAQNTIFLSSRLVNELESAHERQSPRCSARSGLCFSSCVRVSELVRPPENVESLMLNRLKTLFFIACVSERA
jgi:hypothetical protein